MAIDSELAEITAEMQKLQRRHQSLADEKNIIANDVTKLETMEAEVVEEESKALAQRTLAQKR